jgi:hypothetical protein
LQSSVEETLWIVVPNRIVLGNILQAGHQSREAIKDQHPMRWCILLTCCHCPGAEGFQPTEDTVGGSTIPDLMGNPAGLLKLSPMYVALCQAFMEGPLLLSGRVRVILGELKSLEDVFGGGRVIC